MISHALARSVTPSCGVVDSVGAIGCGLFAGITLLRLLRRGAPLIDAPFSPVANCSVYPYIPSYTAWSTRVFVLPMPLE